MKLITLTLILVLSASCGSKDEENVVGPAPTPAVDARCNGNVLVNSRNQNYGNQNYGNRGRCQNGSYITVENNQSGYYTNNNQWYVNGPYYFNNNQYTLGTYDSRYRQNGGAFYRTGNNWTWQPFVAGLGTGILLNQLLR